MAEQWERMMPCTDAHSRDREIRVFIAHENGRISIGLHTPPGDVAQFSPASINRLNDLLAAAVLEATHRGAEWG